MFLPDPAKAPWVTGFIDQWTAFPNAKHDDMVDAASQALHGMIYSRGSLWEDKEQQPVFDINRLFDPYRIERML